MKKDLLGNHVEVLSGFAFKSELFSDSEGFPLVRIRDVVRGHSETYYDGPYDDRYVIADGNVLIGMDGEFNVARWRGGRALLNQRVCRIRPSSGVLDEGYLFRFLPRALKRIEDATPFVTVKHLSVKDIFEIEIPLPPLSEQKRIAAVLDAADALRAKRRAALAQLDSLTQAIFIEMFGDPVMNTREWPIKKFSQLGSLDRGVSTNRPRNAPELLGGPYPLVQTGEIANSGGYVRSHTATYSEAGLCQSKMWPAGTLCITIAANIAKTGILTFDACFPDSVVGFRAAEPAITEYARVWLSFLQKTLEDNAPESAQKNINLGLLRGLPMPTPPIELMREFHQRLLTVNGLDSVTQSSAAHLDSLFAALQHSAFRGEL